MTGQKRIRKLDETTINRIAAGEIIQRPSNAIKELIENSIDASATTIHLSFTNAGLKLISISDNGSGIHKDDLPLLCERFTTSKLSCFDDLKSLNTYGFRGEALASISHIAHLSVSTKTKDSNLAYKAAYLDGKMIPNSLKPTAGNIGTTITIEDLFYNQQNRKKAFKNVNEEYSRILDVIQKYSIHNSHIKFTCKKHGSNHLDLNTIPSNTIDAITRIYGSNLAKQLIELSHSSSILHYKLHACFSVPNAVCKRKAVLLFINQRLVDCISLKKSIDQLYTKYLSKQAHYIIYISLEIEPHLIDVNVHPTKSQVHFLKEDLIVMEICNVIEEKLKDHSGSRSFPVQTVFGASSISIIKPDKSFNNNMGISSQSQQSQSSQNSSKPHLLVRTDSRTRTLDSFVDKNIAHLNVNKKQRIELIHELKTSDINADVIDTQINDIEDNTLIVCPGERISGSVEQTIEDYHEQSSSADTTLNSMKPSDVLDIKHYDAENIDSSVSTVVDTVVEIEVPKQWIDIHLTSVLELIGEISAQEHKGLTEIFHEHTFVGYYNEQLALIQHQTNLLLVNYVDISQQFFYQTILKGVSNFGLIEMTPVCVKECVIIMLDTQDGLYDEERMAGKDEMAQEVMELLIEKSAMLLEYFSIRIDSNGYLTGLPVLLTDYIPNMVKLPEFILRLATHVNWQEEKPCFEAVSTELSIFYQFQNIPQLDLVRYEYEVNHMLFPALRNVIGLGKWVEDGVVRNLASLHDLYKIFERC
ncbi:mutL-like protein 1, colon cancer, nonpolyposis type 2 [Globomyces pollinis-pini]|nr:mutL-like protein 1, colon cancer, nonpolyposis type 2 [Globomyces pollinis-pini]